MRKGIICLLGALLVSACLPFGTEPLPAPQAIIVRNLSGVDLTLVTLSAARTAKGEPRRFGSVSPVLNGTEQVTERGASPPPLPQYVELLWEERGGREYRRSVDLGPVLRQAQGLKGFSLVFEVGPGGGLNVQSVNP
jgi:hypothetical protein